MSFLCCMLMGLIFFGEKELSLFVFINVGFVILILLFLVVIMILVIFSNVVLLVKYCFDMMLIIGILLFRFVSL